MVTVPRLLTYEDWLTLPPVEDGTDEVVQGELRFMPPTRYPHAEIIQLLIEAMLPQIDRKKVRILGSNFGLMISREPLTCRSPDLAVYWTEKMVIQDGLYYSAPDLIVEVLSPSENRSRKEEKLADYAAIGVPEVWLCSPQARSVEVLQLSSGRVQHRATVVEGTLEPVKFLGVEIELIHLWPE
jgi:Uma2 family endonuclease